MHDNRSVGENAKWHEGSTKTCHHNKAQDFKRGRDRASQPGGLDVSLPFLAGEEFAPKLLELRRVDEIASFLASVDINPDFSRLQIDCKVSD